MLLLQIVEDFFSLILCLSKTLHNLEFVLSHRRTVCWCGISYHLEKLLKLLIKLPFPQFMGAWDRRYICLDRNGCLNLWIIILLIWNYLCWLFRFIHLLIICERYLFSCYRLSLNCNFWLRIIIAWTGVGAFTCKLINILELC